MSEFEPTPRPAREGAAPDFRRLEVTQRRFRQYLEDGIAEALGKQTEVDHSTARCIAHVLGRAYGRESLLAEFGRTGEGSYLDLREEYLDLYSDEQATAEIKQLIDWFGTYLINKEHLGSGRQFMNEHLPPKLEQVLVATGITVGGEHFTVHIRGSYGDDAIAALRETLTELRLPEDEALQAFLSLPDVDAMGGDIMESFHESYITTFACVEDAIQDLLEVGELEKEVHDFAAERGLYIDSVVPDYEMLLDRAREAFDIVDWKGAVHAFSK